MDESEELEALVQKETQRIMMATRGDYSAAQTVAIMVLAYVICITSATPNASAREYMDTVVKTVKELTEEGTITYVPPPQER